MPRMELNELDRGGHGAYTLALAPFAFGLIGFAADRAVGWTPVLTVVGAIYGLGGGVYKVVTDYRRKMAELDRTPCWAEGVVASEAAEVAS